MRHHQTELITVSKKRCEMDSVTMSLACRAEQRTVMVNGSRTSDYLVLAVAIDITDRNAVDALTEA